MKKNNTGALLLKYTGIVLVVFSFLEILFAMLNMMRLDMEAIGYGGVLGQLLTFQAGNSAVSLLLGIVGLAAGAAGIALGGKERYNTYLNWFGAALMVIYVIEAFILISNGSSTYSWIRIVVLLVVAVLYFAGAWMNGRSIKEAEQNL